MIFSIARKIFGSANERYIKTLRPIVDKINQIEADFIALSDDQLRNKTTEYKERLSKGETLDDILPEAFATVREAAKRTLGQRHYDVQLIGGMVLHQNKIAEMRTGEGKTLVSTLAAYLNALSGKGVHIVTVNDYLAERDAGWMGKVHEFLGLTVGCITEKISNEERRAAYNCDITYATNNQLGFDYLRDNMCFRMEDMVHRPEFGYAIIDEVDSILIDEARTPLIISGPAEEAVENYATVDRLIPKLETSHYELDEKNRSVSLTDSGNIEIEKLLMASGLIKEGGLFDAANINLVHFVNKCLSAHKIYQKDKDYIVKDGRIVIIDEFTGRMMEGRRFSNGLHQAIEAKERVKIEAENQTLASITFQNYFRMYPKLSGMTGTAMTEVSEFIDIYGLDVVDIPTHISVSRKDMDDEIYMTAEEKYKQIIALIKDCNERQQPILVGTVSIEKSELIAKLLKKQTNIKFEILNAKQHEREAHIIMQAGMPGAVTIATNMAGRGTDIQLGGNFEAMLKARLDNVNSPEQAEKIAEEIKAEIAKNKQIVLDAGGLYVIGTERHESRRIDNQLRGRSGRQGDPGASKFFLSLEDDLMRIFGGERLDKMLRTFGIKEGEVITHPWLTKSLQKAQEKVENFHYEVRKSLLQYDNVMNEQRKVIYEKRRKVMDADDISEIIKEARLSVVENIIISNFDIKHKSYNIEKAEIEANDLLNIKPDFARLIEDRTKSEDDYIQYLDEIVQSELSRRHSEYPTEAVRTIEKMLYLQVQDQFWKAHLQELEDIRHSVRLRAMGQKDPLNEYKKEAFAMFKDMTYAIDDQFMKLLTHIEIKTKDDADALMPQAPSKTRAIHDQADDALRPEKEQKPTFKHAKFDESNPDTWTRTPRNAPCPCGSGKKYKYCHGQI